MVSGFLVKSLYEEKYLKKPFKGGLIQNLIQEADSDNGVLRALEVRFRVAPFGEFHCEALLREGFAGDLTVLPVDY